MDQTDNTNAVRRRFDTLVIPDLDRLVAEVESRWPLRHSYDHGPDHWRCVAWTGLHLLQETPDCDPAVVFLFALFHDSLRVNEFDDPEHGERGGRLAVEMNAELFQVSPAQLSLRQEACPRHNRGCAVVRPDDRRLPGRGPSEPVPDR